MQKSIFLAGFDGSTGYNKHGNWFDHVAATGHDRTVEQDYEALSNIGIRAVRDTVRWPLVDLGGGRYDFSTVDPLVLASERYQICVIWDLFHYGFPDQLDLLSPQFAQRFADYCHAVAHYLRSRTAGTLWFTPVNEPSFMAHAAGEVGLFAPWLTGRGYELKVALVGAAIAGINAIRAVDPSARMVNADPVCRVVRPDGCFDLEEEVEDFNKRLVFQAWDMLCGRLLPELGGSPAHLDVLGINYYWTNQWEWRAPANADGIVPPLSEDDPRRLTLQDLVRFVWRRYGAELMISETAHIGDQRGPWVHELERCAQVITADGIPLRGICLYPIQSMPEWHAPEVWIPMGLWEPPCSNQGPDRRVICGPMLKALEDLNARASWDAACRVIPPALT
jgi:hypothetical protein